MRYIGSRTFTALGFAALGGALLLTGCSASPTPTPTPTAPTADNAIITITLDEWHMTPSIASVPAGKVTIIDVDKGAVDHETVFLSSTKAADTLAINNDTGKVDETAAGVNVGELEVASGTTDATTFNLAPGHYVVICNVKDHYKNGMHFDLTVTGAAAK